jgi:hypothetical protein
MVINNSIVRLIRRLPFLRGRGEKDMRNSHHVPFFWEE